MQTLYGRDLNYVLKDNLGDSWEDACATLMCEMRMYELECLRRRMEDEVAAEQAAQDALDAKAESSNNSLMSPCRSSIKSPPSSGSPRSAKKVGTGRKMKLEDMLDECAKVDDKEKFTGHSCLLVTWKTNPEVEKFKVWWNKKENPCFKRQHFPFDKLMCHLKDD